MQVTGEPAALSALRATRLVAAIRARSAAEALGAAKAIAHGGIKLIEITFTVPDAVRVMESMANSLPGTTAAPIAPGRFARAAS